MSDLVITAGVRARKGSLQFDSMPATFQADFVTANPNGPTPDSITIAVAGTDILFGELSAPGGIVWIINLDPTNFIRLGTWDGVNWHPFGMLLPGEFIPLRMDRHVRAGPGTAGVVNYRFKADTAPCRARVCGMDP